MKTKKMPKNLMLLIVLFFASLSFSQSKLKMEKPTVVDVVNTDIFTYLTSSEDHTTLVTALHAADLTETLSGSGPFTLFAPTNSAFKALPEGVLESLLKPENKDKLKAILTYHVLPGNFDARTIVNAISANDGEADFKTVNGASISGYVEGGTVILTNATGNDIKITKADISQSNGTIHIIDSVILPE
ncbi:fasciclin domain-containing protein [Olleya sp. YS]|uniref:fasciclin domain-containing protein n=1 Tax=Olleya sp. YS TaxID=3028318 RepID=UPI0024344B2E|nr:fasciclin domain-containing protein [Olleya sp. YS]WGD34191.1 fasciclin domain-containing protein [Olleya sp. YS]